MFSRVQELYADLWKAIIRPPRDVYSDSHLGPLVFSVEGRTFQRTDLQIRNARGLLLECSWFEPIGCSRPGARLPCVVALHGNCGSRVMSLSMLPLMLPLNVTVFCFDFGGSGRSEGDYISLGYHERDDVAAVVRHLRDSATVSSVALWGRSMGAVTALMYAREDPSVSGLVLDSPFSDLRELAVEMVDKVIPEAASAIPRFVLNAALSVLRQSILTHGDVDIDDLAPIKLVPETRVPALFLAAYDDDFVKPHHTRALFEAYGGDARIIMCEGDHNMARPRATQEQSALFLYCCLGCDLLPPLVGLDKLLRRKRNDQTESEHEARE